MKRKTILFYRKKIESIDIFSTNKTKRIFAGRNISLLLCFTKNEPKTNTGSFCFKKRFLQADFALNLKNNFEIDNFYRKVKHICEDCLNKKNKCQVCEKTSSQKCLPKHKCEKINQPDSCTKRVSRKNGKIFVGPCFSVETYLMLKKNRENC